MFQNPSPDSHASDSIMDDIKEQFGVNLILFDSYIVNDEEKRDLTSFSAFNTEVNG